MKLIFQRYQRWDRRISMGHLPTPWYIKTFKDPHWKIKINTHALYFLVFCYQCILSQIAVYNMYNHDILLSLTEMSIVQFYGGTGRASSTRQFLLWKYFKGGREAVRRAKNPKAFRWNRKGWHICFLWTSVQRVLPRMALHTQMSPCNLTFLSSWRISTVLVW